MTTRINFENITLREISQKKLRILYDFAHMWDIKLKATNEQTRKTSTQKLIHTDSSIVVTRGKG